jgi:carbonyl reductase 1
LFVGNGIHTILGCRNELLGKQAVKNLQDQGLHDVEFRVLDISDQSSISTFAESVARDFDHIDIFVNNAAIAFKNSDPTPFTQQARPTVQINFFGTLWLTEALLPLLMKSNDARIVNVASQAGHLRILRSEALQEEFTSADLTIEKLSQLMHEFVSDVERGEHDSRGWPNTCYGTSKLAVIALTRILSKMYPSILVNACCPGYCATDMSSHKGPRSPQQGAQTPVFLAITLPKGGVSGKFFYDNGEIAW